MGKHVAETTTSTTELTEWWVGLATEEVEALTAKATEYGGLGRALDLIDIGRDLLLSQGFTPEQVTDEWASETGIYFYARGKLSRWTSAVVRGDRVSDDTLHDLGVYVRMAQRVRAVGGWPV